MAPLLFTLRRRDAVAERTMAFHFDKPAGFQFLAGQSVDLTLLTPPETDPEGDTRTFTIASAPRDDEIVIATRLRDTAFSWSNAYNKVTVDLATHSVGGLTKLDFELAGKIQRAAGASRAR